MLHVFDLELLRGATADSHIKVVSRDGDELGVFAVTTNEDGDVLIILDGGEC